MKTFDVLVKVFGSINRVKIIRLFLLNPEEFFSLQDICHRLKILKQSIRKETALLKTIEFIKSKSEFVAIKPQKNKRAKKIKINGWRLNDSFPLLNGFKKIILDDDPLSRDQLLKKIQRAGRMKLVILSGVFNDSNPSNKNGSNPSSIDVLVVGDGIRRGVLEKSIRDIEAEIGKEITYAAFSTQDFSYRFGMYDKFIRDVLDFPHEKLIDKIGI